MERETRTSATTADARGNEPPVRSRSWSGQRRARRKAHASEIMKPYTLRERCDATSPRASRTRSCARPGLFKQSAFQLDQPLLEFRNCVVRCGLTNGRNLGCAVKLGQTETRNVRLDPEIDRSIAQSYRCYAPVTRRCETACRERWRFSFFPWACRGDCRQTQGGRGLRHQLPRRSRRRFRQARRPADC